MEYDRLLKLIEAVSASNLTEFRYEEGNIKVYMSSLEVCTKEKPEIKNDCTAAEDVQIDTVLRTLGNVMDKEQDAKVQPEKQESGNIVKSPLVGVFYTSPTEDGAPFVCIGDPVKKGQTLAIVEAMKLMNDIESEYDGVICEVLVGNGEAVEYGQPLFRIA